MGQTLAHKSLLHNAIIIVTDRRLAYMSRRPDVIPRYVFSLKPMSGDTGIDLKAIRHEKQNQPHRPCDQSLTYNFFECIERSIMTKVGCQPPWRSFSVNELPLCDNHLLLQKYEKFLQSYNKKKS